MHVVANAGPLVCSECDHTIPEGSPCISEIPEQMHGLNSAGRSAFRHFHVSCEECQTGRPCYEVHASRQPTSIAQKRTTCAYCARPIPAGGLVLRDSFLTLNEESGARGNEKAGQGLASLLNVPLMSTPV